MAKLLKHKVSCKKEVIYNGKGYMPDKEGFVLLPGVLENADVKPVDSVKDETPENTGKDEGDNQEDGIGNDEPSKDETPENTGKKTGKNGGK